MRTPHQARRKLENMRLAGERSGGLGPRAGDHSYRIQHNESCPCNVLAGERFRVRYYDKYAGTAADEALRKLAAELYKAFFQ